MKFGSFIATETGALEKKEMFSHLSKDHIENFLPEAER